MSKEVEVNNQCGVVSKELISPADLIRAQFVVSIKRRFLQRLIRIGALHGPIRALFFVFLG